MLLIWQKSLNQKNKYFDIQYKNFLKNTDKDKLKEAFVEKKPEPEPEPKPRYNLRGMDM